MRFIDFFAGIGTIRLGMEQAGHECVGFCEFDKYAVASYTSMHLITEEQRTYLETLPLKKRQKEILNEKYRNGEWFASDIRRVSAAELPRSDCWCFGAPCQDFSIAGRRDGLDGERSSLVREIFRLLGETREEDRPTWLLYENVRGMLSSNKGFDFLAILLEMDKVGYDIEWQLLNSKYHGVPQNRERVFTIGHFRGRGGRKVFPIIDCGGEADVIQGHKTIAGAVTDAGRLTHGIYPIVGTDDATDRQTDRQTDRSTRSQEGISVLKCTGRHKKKSVVAMSNKPHVAPKETDVAFTICSNVFKGTANQQNNFVIENESSDDNRHNEETRSKEG